MFSNLSLLKNPDKFEELKDINTNKIDEVINPISKGNKCVAFNLL